MDPEDDAADSNAQPPEHLTGLNGMDLVRRVLEEARGAARPRSPAAADPAGRGRQPPPLVGPRPGRP